MNHKILLVDDDARLLEGLQRSLGRQFNIETAGSGAEALSKFANEGPYALVVADMQMPGMTGLEFLRIAQVQSPETVRLMLTGNADLKTAVDAVKDGRVFRFLTKPCPVQTLAPVLEAGLESYLIAQAERELLESTLRGTVQVLTEALAAVEPATFERGQRLRTVCRQLAAAVNLTVNWEIEIAAMLHAVGRLVLSASIREKIKQGAPLSLSERAELGSVPAKGADLLLNVPRLQKVASAVRYQDNYFDGSDSPTPEILGKDIPLGARFLKCAGDLLDLRAQGLSQADALRAMRENAGRYDPDMLQAALREEDAQAGKLEAVAG